jgi:hypothetical protein
MARGRRCPCPAARTSDLGHRSRGTAAAHLEGRRVVRGEVGVARRMQLGDGPRPRCAVARRPVATQRRRAERVLRVIAKSVGSVVRPRWWQSARGEAHTPAAFATVAQRSAVKPGKMRRCARRLTLRTSGRRGRGRICRCARGVDAIERAGRPAEAPPRPPSPRLSSPGTRASGDLPARVTRLSAPPVRGTPTIFTTSQSTREESPGDHTHGRKTGPGPWSRHGRILNDKCQRG